MLINGDRILLGLKKRGFGVARWNGPGGKVKAGERIKTAAHREVKEEFGVEVRDVERVALLHFYFSDGPESASANQDVHVFLVRKWTGNPSESEEMGLPQWFSPSQLKYLTMWADDKFWLPRVLSGEMLEGWFAFDGDEEVLGHLIKNVEEGGRIS